MSHESEICKVCGSTSLSALEPVKYLIGDGYSKAYVQQVCFCNTCGMIYVKNPMDLSQITQYYKEGSAYNEEFYFRNSNVSSKTKSRFLAQFDYITSHINITNSVLEVGCSTGYNLEQYKQSGKDVLGIESSKLCARIAKERYNLPIYNGMIEDFLSNNKSQCYDLIIFSHVLEHILDPLDIIKRVSCINSEYIYIEVPTFNRAQEDGLMGVFVDEHVNYFTEDSLENMMNLAGYCMVNLDRYGSKNKVWGDPIMSLWKKSDNIATTNLSSTASKKKLEDYLKNDKIKSIILNKKIDEMDNKTRVGLYGSGNSLKKILANTNLNQKNICRVYDDSVEPVSKQNVLESIYNFSLDDIKRQGIEKILICASFSQDAIYQELMEHEGIQNQLIKLFAD